MSIEHNEEYGDWKTLQRTFKAACCQPASKADYLEHLTEHPEFSRILTTSEGPARKGERVVAVTHSDVTAARICAALKLAEYVEEHMSDLGMEECHFDMWDILDGKTPDRDNWN